MVVLGIILLLVAAGLFFGHFRSRRGVQELRGVERRQAGDLAALVREIGEEVGAGSFRERVELVGRVDCREPLVAPLSEQPCVYYHTVVKREYEETVVEGDSSGGKRQTTRRSSDVVSEEHRSCPFRLSDDSGAIAIVPDGASYDGLISTVDRFDRGEADELSLGRFVMTLTALAGGRRTLGYRYSEHIVPVDRPLTIIGEVSDQLDEVAVRKGEGRLLVSTRTREQMMGSARKAAMAFLVLSLLTAGGGLALLVAGLVG